MAYNIHSNGYLARARARLLEDSQEGLFYAAFELRCFIEARQDEYLDAQREYARSIPKAHKIGAQGKQLEKLFRSSHIQHVEFSIEGEALLTGFHVPVPKTLRKRAERLGELLHAQMKFRRDDDGWWADTRSWLLAFYRDAWPCSKNNLLSPMFLKDGHTVGKFAFGGDEAEMTIMRDLMRAGAIGVVKVDYLSKPPADWVCDL